MSGTKQAEDDVNPISKDFGKTDSLKRKSADDSIKGKLVFRKMFPENANPTRRESTKRQSVPTRLASALANLLSRKKHSSESSTKSQKKDVISSPTCRDEPVTSTECSGDIDVQVAISFTSQERHLLRETWSLLKHDIALVGIETFMGLFNTHPDAIDSFLVFKDYNIHDIEQSAILKAHTLRVMQTVDKCVSRLEEPDKMASVLISLGGRHVGYQAERRLIPIIGKQFIAAIEPKMADQWSGETREAWEHLFEVINFHMDKGIASQVLKAARQDHA